MTTQRIVSNSWIFLSAMNFVIFFIYIPLVHSVSHTFITTYTVLSGEMVAGTPEFSAVTTLNGRQIDYYDREIKKLIPTQDWMKEFASGDKWKKYTEIREQVQQIYKRFRKSHGVHVYKRIYGCVWDDKTEVSHGFDRHSYDGEDFISLDLKEGRYTAHVPQAEPTVIKWNNDRVQLDFLKQYYKHECIDWLKEFLKVSKAAIKKTAVHHGVPPSWMNPSLNEPILTDTESSGSASDALNIVLQVIIVIILVIMSSILLYALWKNWNELEPCFQKLGYYNKVKETPPDESSDQDQDTS